MHEITKKEKKIARAIISASIEKEFETALKNSEITISKWKNNMATGREVFHEMNEYLNNFRKHLERRYDNLRGSDYLLTVAAILKEHYITEEDLKVFSDETKEMISRYNNLL